MGSLVDIRTLQKGLHGLQSLVVGDLSSKGTAEYSCLSFILCVSDQTIDNGRSAPGLIAHVALAKFDWHLPLYRQERIYRAQGVPIARSSMSRMFGEGATLVKIVVDLMHTRMLDARLVQSDATGMPVIIKGLGKTHPGFSWIYRDERYILFDFTEAHNGDQPPRVLLEYQGVLLTDGAAVYNDVIKMVPRKPAALRMRFVISRMRAKTIQKKPITRSPF